MKQIVRGDVTYQEFVQQTIDLDDYLPSFISSITLHREIFRRLVLLTKISF